MPPVPPPTSGVSANRFIASAKIKKGKIFSNDPKCSAVPVVYFLEMLTLPSTSHLALIEMQKVKLFVCRLKRAAKCHEIIVSDVSFFLFFSQFAF